MTNMKNLFILAMFLLYAGKVLGQAPDKFNYQALAVDAQGEVIANQNIGIFLAIKQGSEDGEISYSESFSITTNSAGIFSLQVGNGIVESGNIASIDWSNGPFFLEVSMDADGGTNYSLLGSQQLFSVPFALYANQSGNIHKPCPQGFVSINDSYCIEITEHSPQNWFEAAITCGNLNAELCTWNQWYYAAHTSGSEIPNLTDNWEWLNDGGDDKSNNAKVVGFQSIENDDSFDVFEVSNAFRCCFKK